MNESKLTFCHSLLSMAKERKKIAPTKKLLIAALELEPALYMIPDPILKRTGKPVYGRQLTEQDIGKR